MSTQPPRPPDWSRQGSGGPPPWEGQQPGGNGPAPFGPPQPRDAYGRPQDPSGWPPAGPGQGYGGYGGDGDPGGRPGGGGRKAAAAVGLVAVAVVGSFGGYWLGHRGGSSAASASAPATSATTSPSRTTAPSKTSTPAATRKVALADVAEVDAADARAQVRKVVPVQGTGVEAWGWTDTNGRNLLLATKSVQKAEGSVVRAATLHVYHVAGLDSTPRSMLTPLRDSGVTDCDVDFLLDFVPGSMKVTDTDGDGYGEATVGWSSLCAGDPEPQRIKLALVTKGTYYILRGTGQRATDPALPDGITFPKASFTPNVPGSRWPKGTYAATVDLFHTLFK